MKISETLRLAADKFLWDGKDSSYLTRFSCCAVSAAVASRTGEYDDHCEARLFVQAYLNFPEADGAGLLWIESPAECQQARYAWLHLLAYIAEQEGR